MPNTLISAFDGDLKAGEYATAVEIYAEDGKELPAEIEIMRPVSIKNSPTHPDFEITESDLDEYASNFKANIRKGVPIDIEHGNDPKFGKQAAGWVKDVYTKVTDSGKALFAKPEWNALGKELVGDKRYRFISPQFTPKSLGAYEDPEGKGTFNNVLKAVTVTNIPLFKGLQALSASEENVSGLTYRLLPNIIYAEELKGATMNLDTVRTKAPSDLSAEEKQLLADHKAELSAEEQTKFGLEAEAGGEEKPAEGGEAKPAEGEPATPEAKPAEPVAASETVTISASELSAMKTTMATLEVKANEGAEAMRQLKEKETSEFVATHVKRGAIKPGEAEATVTMIMASEDGANMRKLIENLPDRVVNASEVGKGDNGSLNNAADALDAKVKEIAASEEGKNLEYAAQVKLAIKQNPDLAREYAEKGAE